MPTYEYICEACGHALEIFQRMSDEPLTQCPYCHKQKLKKLVSAANFQLKGGGWYKTDYTHPSAQTKTDTKTETTSPSETEKTPKVENAATKSDETSNKT